MGYEGTRLSLNSLSLVPIPVNHPPAADVGEFYTGIAGEPVAFDGSLSGDPDDDPLTYEWDFGDGTTGTGESANHTYVEPGTYTATLVVNDGQLSSELATAPVVVSSCNPCLNWKNHGQYVRCVAHDAEFLVESGDLTQDEADAIVSSAAQSEVGKKNYVSPECQ